MVKSRLSIGRSMPVAADPIVKFRFMLATLHQSLKT